MKTSHYPGENTNGNPKNVHLPAAWGSTFALNILLHLKIIFIVLYHFSVHLPSRRWFSIWYNMIWNTINCVWPHFQYPASSWCLLRQTREKPLRATVCFPSSVREFGTLHVLYVISISFVSYSQNRSSVPLMSGVISFVANLISVIISIICLSNE